MCVNYKDEKIIIFGGYIILVSQMKDIKRVFEYHGAEHKSIFCYENGEELTVENVKKYDVEQRNDLKMNKIFLDKEFEQPL